MSQGSREITDKSDSLIILATIQQLLVLCFALTPKQDLNAIILVIDSYHQSKPSKMIIYPFEPWAFAESLQDLKHINSKSKKQALLLWPMAKDFHQRWRQLFFRRYVEDI